MEARRRMEPVVQQRKEQQHPHSWSSQPGSRWDELRGRSKSSRVAGRVRYQSDTPKAIHHLWPFSLAPWTSHFSWTTLFLPLASSLSSLSPSFSEPQSKEEIYSCDQRISKGHWPVPIRLSVLYEMLLFMIRTTSMQHSQHQPRGRVCKVPSVQCPQIPPSCLIHSHSTQ